MSSRPTATSSPGSTSSEDLKNDARTRTDSVTTEPLSDGVNEKAGLHFGTDIGTNETFEVISGQRLEILKGIPPLGTIDDGTKKVGFGRTLLQKLGFSRTEKDLQDLDAVATQPAVFDTAQGVHYHPAEGYEGYKAFDPLFRWTKREERSAVRIVDWKIFAWVMLMFFALDLDRYNIQSATSDNFLNDLGLTQADYNLGNTLFRVGFLVAELPSQLVSKRLGPDVWLPIQMVIFSVISTCQFWLKGRTSFLITRFLISFFQGGFIPDVILYLSYYYTKTELPIRLGFFWVMNYFALLVSNFLAAGILQMRGVGGHAGWRYMFLIEGLITVVISVMTFWMLPSSPSGTISRLRPNGYFSPSQVKILVNRALRDDPTKSSMHNRQALPVRTIIRCIGNYHMYPLYLIGLTFGLGGYPVSQYFQLSMRSLGFSTIQSNLLSIPNSVLSMFNLIAITILSEVVDSRALVCMSEALWMVGPYIALLTLPDPVGGWQYFAIATVLLGFPYVHAIQVAWVSRNSGSVENRTVSASLYNMAVQVSAIIGSNLYQASDKPRYKRGNSAILAILAFNVLVLYPFARWYFKSRNSKRSKLWDGMSSEEKDQYLSTTKDRGNSRLDFRFAY